jgi:hypothetical protein
MHFFRWRTKAVITRRKQDEMLIGKAEANRSLKLWLESRLVILQAAMHEKIMGLAPNYAQRILGLTDVVVAHRISKELSVGLLNELQLLPTKVADPHWLETLEKGEADSSKDV